MSGLIDAADLLDRVRDFEKTVPPNLASAVATRDFSTTTAAKKPPVAIQPPPVETLAARAEHLASMGSYESRNREESVDRSPP